MKLRTKLLTMGAPVAAVATVLPMTLTACGVTLELPARTDVKGEHVQLYAAYGKHDIDTKTTFDFSGVKATIADSNAVVVLAMPSGGTKYLKPSFIKVNGKSLSLKEETVFGYTAWVGSITEKIATDANIKFEVKFAEEGKDCTIEFGIGHR